MDFLAIIAGIGVAIGVSSLAGLIFGIGHAVDTSHDIDPEHDDPEAFDAAFDAATTTTGFAVQIIVFSAGASLLSGGVTAWLAPQAPYLNAGIVGAVGTAIGFAGMAVMPNFPKGFAIFSALATFPVTLAGAWLMI